MYTRSIELAGGFKGRLNRLLGDFVKDHSMIAARITANGFLKMPGDRLSLSVQIGCQIDSVAVFCELL